MCNRRVDVASKLRGRVLGQLTFQLLDSPIQTATTLSVHLQSQATRTTCSGLFACGNSLGELLFKCSLKLLQCSCSGWVRAASRAQVLPQFRQDKTKPKRQALRHRDYSMLLANCNAMMQSMSGDECEVQGDKPKMATRLTRPTTN